MSDNTSKIKVVGKATLNTLGFLSLMFGSIIVLGIALRLLSGIFVFSTKPLFYPKRGEDDTNQSLEEGE